MSIFHNLTPTKAKESDPPPPPRTVVGQEGDDLLLGVRGEALVLGNETCKTGERAGDGMPRLWGEYAVKAVNISITHEKENQPQWVPKVMHKLASKEIT